MVYVPNPDDVTNPTDGIGAESAQAEFRALKGKIAGLQGIITAWNPSDKSAAAILSAGNLQITNGNNANANCSARTNVGISNKSVYWEVKLLTAAAAMYIGIAQITSSFIANNQFVGNDAVSYSYRSDGTTWNNNVSTALGAAAVAGDVIGINYNGLTGALSFYKNGVLIGAGPAYNAIDTTKTWYPAITLVDSNDSAVANFGLSAFAFSAPAGAVSMTQPVVIVSGIRNILYNGLCEIDAINGGGATVPASGNYCIDGFKYFSTQTNKWNSQQNAGAVAGPPGIPAYLGMTNSASGYAVLATDSFYILQPIEGWMIRHLDFGLATAKTVTLSAWVYSSITGLHSGALTNAAANRSYPFQFLISQANTWTPIAIVIPGDIIGTWPTTTAAGMAIRWNLGSGANSLNTANVWTASALTGVTGSVSIIATASATFYITGVDLRDGIYGVGQVNERIPFDVNLERCRRYYQAKSVFVPAAAGEYTLGLPTAMRTAPTITGGGAGFVAGWDNTSNAAVSILQTTGAPQNLALDARM